MGNSRSVFLFVLFVVFGSHLLFNLLENTTLLLLLCLPRLFSALILRLIPRPRPDGTDFMTLITPQHYSDPLR